MSLLRGSAQNTRETRYVPVVKFTAAQKAALAKRKKKTQLPRGPARPPATAPTPRWRMTKEQKEEKIKAKRLKIREDTEAGAITFVSKMKSTRRQRTQTVGLQIQRQPDKYPNQQNMKRFLKLKNHRGISVFLTWTQGNQLQRKCLIKAGFLEEVGDWLLHGKHWKSDQFTGWDISEADQANRTFDLDLCHDILGAFLGFVDDPFLGRGPRYKIKEFLEEQGGALWMKNEALGTFSMGGYTQVSGIPVVELDDAKNKALMDKARDKWCLDPVKFRLERPQVLSQEFNGETKFYVTNPSLDIWNNFGGKLLYGILFDNEDSIITDAGAKLHGFAKLQELFGLYKETGVTYTSADDLPQVSSVEIGPLWFMLHKLREKWTPIKDYMKKFEDDKRTYLN